MLYLDEAKTDKGFHDKYVEQLLATGETPAEYSVYRFEVADDYYLLIDFVNYQLEDFSLISLGHEEIVLREAEG